MRKQSLKAWLLLFIGSLSTFSATDAEVVNREWVGSPGPMLSVERLRNTATLIEMYRRSASISTTDGRKTALEVAVLYEPKSGLLWWLGSAAGNQPRDPSQFLESHVIYLDDNRVIVFWVSSLGNLIIKESRERVGSMEQAWKMIAAQLTPEMADFPDRSAAEQKAVVVPEEQFLNVAEAVPEISPEDSRLRVFTLSVRSASRNGDQWIVAVVTEFGTGGLLTLNAQFQVLEVDKMAGKFHGPTFIK